MTTSEMAEKILSGEILTALSPVHRKYLNDYIENRLSESKQVWNEIFQRRGKSSSPYLEKISDLEQKLAVAVEALDYYADKNSYTTLDNQFRIMNILANDIYSTEGALYFYGGDRANKALAKIRG